MSILREAFIDELKDLLDAERQLLKALPTMARAAENDQLRTAFEVHEQQTRQQIARLGRVFEAFEEEAKGIHCKGMEGLLEEAEELIEKKEGDAALIAAAQKAEHYEIAAYGTLASWAVALGQDGAVQALNETLQEEKETDKKLTAIAQNVVNSMDSLRDEDGKSVERTRVRRTNRRSARASSAKPRSQRQSSGRAARSKRQSSRGGSARKTRGSRSKRQRASKR